MFAVILFTSWAFCCRTKEQQAVFRIDNNILKPFCLKILDVYLWTLFLFSEGFVASLSQWRNHVSWFLWYWNTFVYIMLKPWSCLLLPNSSRCKHMIFETVMIGKKFHFNRNILPFPWSKPSKTQIEIGLTTAWLIVHLIQSIR